MIWELPSGFEPGDDPFTGTKLAGRLQAAKRGLLRLTDFHALSIGREAYAAIVAIEAAERALIFYRDGVKAAHEGKLRDEP